MKNFLILLIIIVNVILQSTLFHYFKIFDVLPNSALILVIIFAVYKGKNIGAVIGLVIGILQDILFGKMLGLNSMIYMAIGYGVGSMNNKLYRDNLIVPFLLTAAATVLYESINMMFIYFMGYKIEFLNVFKKMMVVSVIYNSIISVLAYIFASKFFGSKMMKKKRY